MYMDVIMNIFVHNSAYIWILSYAFKSGWTRKKLNSELYKKANVKPVNFGSQLLCLASISSEKFELVPT